MYHLLIWNCFTNCTERCVSIVMQRAPCKFQLRKSRHEVKHNYIVFWLHSVYKQYLCDRIHLIAQLHWWYRTVSEICNKISNWSSIDIGSIIDTYTFPIPCYVCTINSTCTAQAQILGCPKHELSNSLHNFIKWMRLRERARVTHVGHLNALHRSLGKFSRELLQNPHVQQQWNEIILLPTRQSAWLAAGPITGMQNKFSADSICALPVIN